MKRRLAELCGVIIWGLALILGLALWSYNPLDPSFNTASTQPVTNLAGTGGAFVSDILLQGTGVGSLVVLLALVAWGWRIVRHKGIRPLPLRLVALLCAVPITSTFANMTAAALPSLAGPQIWGQSGPGGGIGSEFSAQLLAVGHSLGGSVGCVVLWGVCGVLLLSLIPLAMGLSWQEWRAIGATTRKIVAAPRYLLGHKRNAQPKNARFSDPRTARTTIKPQVFATARQVPHTPQRKAAPQTPNHAPAPYAPPPRAAQQPPVTVHALLKEQPHADEPQAAPPPEKEGARFLDRLLTKPKPAEAPPVAERSPAPPQPAEHLSQPDAPAVAGGGETWQLPTLELLHPAPRRAESGPSQETLQERARMLETVLSEYGVQGTIGNIHGGPVVTLYELEPAPGIRSARVIGLADDIARSMSVISVRIATVPGRNVIGIEVPNSSRDTVYFSELLTSDAWKNSQKSGLPLALGKNIFGEPIYADLSKMPHLLIAGTTGSGKSVGVNAMILSILYQMSPDQCRFLMIDPKMLELSIYNGIPHLLTPVVTEPAKAVTALKWVVRKMEQRYRAMSQLGVRNMKGYNDRVAEARARGEVVTRKVQTGFDPETGKPTFEEQQLALETLPYIVVVIDEMADLMMVAGKEIEAAVQRLAQMARAAGIHVIMATQRPSVDVITGTIKANFPTRISFQVISKFDSRTILGEQGAEQLLGQGDMLYMQGGGRITRVHGPFVADDEVDAVVQFLRQQGEPVYDDDVLTATEEDDAPAGRSAAGGEGGDNDLYNQAVALVVREGKASISFIQRHLSIGYNRAAKIIEQMEKEKVIGPANHVGKREILLSRPRDEE